MKSCEKNCAISGVCNPEKKTCCNGYSCESDSLGFTCQKTHLFSNEVYTQCNDSNKCNSGNCHKMSCDAVQLALPNTKCKDIIGVCVPSVQMSTPFDFLK